MSAERLREAAQVLRERATEAADGAGPIPSKLAWPLPWIAAEREDCGCCTNIRTLDRGALIANTDDRASTYIATMHPGVGLALADWLDGVAGAAERKGLRKFARGYKSALIVAEAILGGAS